MTTTTADVSDRKPNVLVIGGTGTIGVEVLNGLLDSDNFNLSATVRPSSIAKPIIESFRSRGVQIRAFDLADPAQADLDGALNALMRGIDIVLSTVNSGSLETQKRLIDAAKRAGVKRFIPSDWATPCVRGVRKLHDEKLKIHDYVEASGIGYTYIDVGVLMHFTTPLTAPSQAPVPGFFDISHYYYDEGAQKTALIYGPDIGKYAARIIADPRTLNKYVFCCGDEKTQKEIWDIVKRKVKTDVPMNKIPSTQLQQWISDEKVKATGGSPRLLIFWEYHDSFWVRGDNTIQNSKKKEYGGALVAGELYPDFAPKSFEEFVGDFYKDEQ